MISIILTLHIIAGSLAIIAGFLTLVPKKGTRLHILFGKIFFFAMLGMAGTASFLAVFSSSETINAVIGLFTLYLVLTGRLAATNHSGNNTSEERIGGFFSGLLFLSFLLLSIKAVQSGESVIDGVYVEAFYVFTTLSAIAFLLDIKVLLKGGVFGRQRIARHLWRMILALFIATSSLFSGQPQVFPEAIQSSGLLEVPGLLIVLALLFWIIRVYSRKRFAS